MSQKESYRVIQWATGGVGREMLAGVLDLPELQLVGVRVYDEAKNGVDPDCVLYAPQFTSVDDVCALLASGKNVATVSPRAHD